MLSRARRNSHVGRRIPFIMLRGEMRLFSSSKPTTPASAWASEAAQYGRESREREMGMGEPDVSAAIVDTYGKVREFIRHHSTILLGAEKLESVKASILQLQDAIKKDKDILFQETNRKAGIDYRLSECVSSIDHITRFRRIHNGEQLNPEEYVRSLSALNKEQHSLQEALIDISQTVNRLTVNIQKMQTLLDEQLAVRYQEELLVLERSRAFSAIATLASFITTILLIISRTSQTNTYERAIQKAQAESEKHQELYAIEIAKGQKRDELLSELIAQLQEVKSVVNKEEGMVKALLAQQDVIKLLTIANNNKSEVTQNEVVDAIRKSEPDLPLPSSPPENSITNDGWWAFSSLNPRNYDWYQNQSTIALSCFGIIAAISLLRK